MWREAARGGIQPPGLFLDTVAQLKNVVFIRYRSVTACTDLKSSCYNIDCFIRGLNVAESRMGNSSGGARPLKVVYCWSLKRDSLIVLDISCCMSTICTIDQMQVPLDMDGLYSARYHFYLCIHIRFRKTSPPPTSWLPIRARL